MTRRRTIACLAAVLLQPQSGVAEPALATLETGQTAPELDLPDLDQRLRRLSDFRGRVRVLEWTSPVCPYTALKYRDGLLPRLQRRARRAGVVWICINTAGPTAPGHLDPEAARARLKRLGADVDLFLFDETGQAGRAFGARTTPSFFIIGRDGRLAYAGALDRDPAAVDPREDTYVGAALHDILAGRPVRTPYTRPYGCAVEY